MLQRLGSSIVKFFLLLFVLALIGFVGWFIWENQRAEETPPVTPQAQTTAELPDTETNEATYSIEIPELGIKFSVPESLKGLTYTYRTSEVDSGEALLIADISSNAIEALDPDCSSKNATSIGAIGKVAEQYPAEVTATNTGGTLVKQYPDYYIGFSQPQASCTEDTAALQLIEELRIVLETSLADSLLEI